MAPWRRAYARLFAVAAIALITALSTSQLGALRGALSFARFRHLKQVAAATMHSQGRSQAVRMAAVETDLVTRFSSDNSDHMWEISDTCKEWAGDALIFPPQLRLRMAEKAIKTGLLAVRAAPSDYEVWRSLARSYGRLGLPGQAGLCLRQCRKLAPPNKKLPSLGE